MEEIITIDDIHKTMDLMYDFFEMNSVPHNVALAACFNIVCLILQRRGLEEKAIRSLAELFECCVREVSGEVYTAENPMPREILERIAHDITN